MHNQYCIEFYFLFVESDYIYWVDTKANSISRIKRDLTKREVVVSEGINSVEGLAVDWIAGRCTNLTHFKYIFFQQ